MLRFAATSVGLATGLLLGAGSSLVSDYRHGDAPSEKFKDWKVSDIELEDALDQQQEGEVFKLAQVFAGGFPLQTKTRQAYLQRSQRRTSVLLGDEAVNFVSHHWGLDQLPLVQATFAQASEESKCATCLTRDTIPDAAARAAPAVVHLEVVIGSSGYVMKMNGSGSIISPDGAILTNYHVIAPLLTTKRQSKFVFPNGPINDMAYGNESVGKLFVTLQDGRRLEGVVVNYDVSSDVAVVKVSSSTPLPTIAFGSSGALRPGDMVIALGSPNSFQNSVTAGIIGNVARTSSELGLVGRPYTDFIQINVKITQGSSGGPLVNLDGEMIGMNTFKEAGTDFGFAIPVDAVFKVLQQLKTHGRVIRPWLGVSTLDITASNIHYYKLTFPHVVEGVLVTEVKQGSPGHRAGIMPGDVIVRLDGQPISSHAAIGEVLSDKIGVALSMVVLRPDKTVVTKEVIPVENPYVPSLFQGSFPLSGA